MSYQKDKSESELDENDFNEYLQQGIQLTKRSEFESSSRIRDENENHESPSYSPIESIDSDYELMDYFNQIDSNYIQNEDLNIIEKNELENLNLYVESLNVLTNIIDKIEANSTNVTFEKNVNCEIIETAKILDDVKPNSNKITYDIKIDPERLTNDVDESLKLSYLNKRSDSEIFQRVELIFLKKLKVAYDHLNEKIKNVYKLEDLNHNTCKYLLDQQIKQVVDDESNQRFLKLKWYLILVACFEALDLMFNCNWESMIFFVYHSFKIYQKCIKDDLEEMFIEIRKIIRPFLHKSIPLQLNDIYSFNTPKIYNLCEYINRFNQKNGANLKFVILIKRDNEILMRTLAKYIQESTNLKINVCEKESDLTNKILNESNCLISLMSLKLDKYIKDFTNLIVYDYPKMNDFLELKEIENIKNICVSNKINYIQFETYIIEDSIKNILIPSISSVSKQLIFNNDITKQLVVSRELLKKYELVEWFESKLNYDLIERDLDFISNKFEISKELLCNVDILIDECTGVLIIDFKKFTKINENDLIDQIKLVKFKIDLLFLILTPLSSNDKTNLNDLFIDLKYIKLTKFCNDLNKRFNDFKIKLITVSKSSQLISTIDQILTDLDKNEISLTKKPIVHEISNEEAFLFSLGCFNSFSAQRMLSIFKIIDIINLQDYNQIENYSIISKNKFNLLHKILNFKE